MLPHQPIRPFRIGVFGDLQSWQAFMRERFGYRVATNFHPGPGFELYSFLEYRDVSGRTFDAVIELQPMPEPLAAQVKAMCVIRQPTERPAYCSKCGRELKEPTF